MSAQSQFNRRSVALKAGLSLTGAMLLLMGCSDNSDEPQVPSTMTGPKPANSVFREKSPQPRSNNLQAQLNTFRTQTYALLPPALPGVVPPSVPHHNVAFTEAYRHAVYLNSINSAGWSFATPSAPDAESITSESEYEDLEPEDTVAATGPWPALFTNSSIYTRLEAVVGGRDLLDQGNCNSSTVFEQYTFTGDVEKEDGTISFFRGYPNTNLSAVDNVWYTRRGRMLLARPSLFAFGFGQKCDDGSIDCGTVPYPIMDGQFNGVVTMLHQNQLNRVMGFWPNNGNTNVVPYGLDTDVGGSDQYSGPPIHISLPVDIPIPRTSGVTTLQFIRLNAFGGVSTTPTNPTAARIANRSFQVFSNVEGLIVPTAAPLAGDFNAAGPIASVLSNLAVSGITVTTTLLLPPGQILTIQLPATTDLSSIIPLGLPAPQVIINVLAGAFPGNYRYDIIAADDDLNTIQIFVPLGQFSNVPPYFPPSVYGNDLTNLKVDIQDPRDLTVAAITDPNLLNGEIVIVPTFSLENNTVYRVIYRFQMPANIGGTGPNGPGDTGTQTFEFRTNNLGGYNP